MSSYKDVEVMCPYFINFSKRDIRCEGIHTGSTIVTHFDRLKDQQNYADGFCCKYPNECMISRALDAKYGE